MGRALGRRLREKGWKIHSVVARSAPSARRAVRSIGAGRWSATLHASVLSAHIILIAVPESAVQDVVAQLTLFGPSQLRGKVVLFTSGAFSSAVLAPLRAHGALLGTLHPLQTFSGVGIPSLEGRVFGLEGDAGALRVSRAITRSLGGHAVHLKGADKPLYHAAAVLACGQVLALSEAAVQILVSLGMKRREALKALLPLSHQVLENLECVGPRAAWTGPLARGDYSVIAMHERALTSVSPEVLVAYRGLNRLAARVLARDFASVTAELQKISPQARPPLKATGATA